MSEWEDEMRSRQKMKAKEPAERIKRGAQWIIDAADEDSLSAGTACCAAEDLAALILQQRDWHELNVYEKRLASLLRERGYLKKSIVAGFTGAAA